MESIVVGQYRITALSDGMSRLPPMFFPGLDPCQHGAGPDPDGTIHIPTGCFLIQGDGRTILVDAGLGPLSLPFPDGIPTAHAVAGGDTPPLSEGGDLPAQLRAAGVESSDVDTVLLTHLHSDHIGWIAPAGTPYFGEASVVFGEPDWADLIDNGQPADPAVQGMQVAREHGRLETITTETQSITPGVTVRHAPGHTAGSYIVVIASGKDRAYLLGDVVQHPLQLNDESISFLTDLDPALAARTRQRVFDAMEREQAAIGMDHFPGLGFQQIIAGSPRKWLPVR